VESLFILIPLALVLAVIIAAAFWWSTVSGQFDDLDQEGSNIIADDDRCDSVVSPNTKRG
jgi:cbb3-type cytochrome oxidase maturation protein